MPATAEYKKAMTALTKSAVEMNASEVFNSLRRNDASVSKAVDAMDTAAGKSRDAMLNATRDFENALNPWLTKLETQAKKEAQGKALAKEMTKFSVALFRMTQDYRKDAEKVQGDEDTASTQGGVRGKGSDVASQAAAKAMAKLLEQAKQELSDRRAEHLKVAREVLRDCRVVAGDVTGTVRTCEEQLGAAQEAALVGNSFAANAAAREIEKMLKLCQKMQSDAHAMHLKKMRDGFQEDRNLSFATYEKKYGLDPSCKADFLKHQKTLAKTFTEATETGREALELIEQMERDCETMAGMVEQAKAAAKGGAALRQNVLDDLTVTTGRTGAAMVSTANEVLDDAVYKLGTSNGNAEGAIRFYMQKRGSEEEARAKEAALGFPDVLNDAVRRVEVARARVDETFRQVRGRVPKAMAKDVEVTQALNTMLQRFAKSNQESKKAVKTAEGLLTILGKL